MEAFVVKAGRSFAPAISNTSRIRFSREGGLRSFGMSDTNKMEEWLTPLISYLGVEYAIICEDHGNAKIQCQQIIAAYPEHLKMVMFGCPESGVSRGGQVVNDMSIDSAHFLLPSGVEDSTAYDGNILDDDGQPIAHWDAPTKTLYVLFDWFHDNPLNMQFSEPFIEHVIKQIISPAATDSIKEKLFDKLYEEQINSRLPTIRNELNSTLTQISSYLDALKDFYRRVDEYKKEIKQLSDLYNKQAGESPYKTIIDKIEKAGKWKFTACSKRYMDFETVNDIVVLLNDVSIKLGHYILRIPWGGGSPFIIRRKEGIKGSAHHPHVTSTICWGNIGTTVSELWGKREYFVLLELVHDYLHSYRSEDCYQTIDKWIDNPEDLKKIGLKCKLCGKHPYECRCKRCDMCGMLLDECECGARTSEATPCRHCGRLPEECECDICEHCGEIMENCECQRCPSSGERYDDDSYCDGCGHLTEDGCGY